jgi:acetyl-CoA carboxylase carboxyltransferase component
MGPCYGSSSWYAAMSDILIIQKGAVTAVSSPKVTEISTGEKVDPEELGGWKVHAEMTGMADCVGGTDEDCIDLTKKLLGYLPTNINETTPEREVPENSGQNMPHIMNYLPEQRNRVYDMRKIIQTIADGEEYTELKAGFGRPCTTGFARLGGKSVGIIANNPYFGAGALDADCCEKITSFLVLCDSYNLPIITLIDTPGFLIGKAGERRKVTGKIMNWMNALQLVTVPKLTMIIRKIYGQAYLNMGGGRNSDLFVAWPTADISFMDPEPAINVVYNLKKEDDPERFDQLLKEMALNTEPWNAAGGFGVQDIIDPAETRDFLIKMLALYQNRLRKGIGKHLMHNWPTSY